MRRNKGQAEKRPERVHRLLRKRKLGGLGGQQGRNPWRDQTEPERRGNG